MVTSTSTPTLALQINNMIIIIVTAFQGHQEKALLDRVQTPEKIMQSSVDPHGIKKGKGELIFKSTAIYLHEIRILFHAKLRSPTTAQQQRTGEVVGMYTTAAPPSSVVTRSPVPSSYRRLPRCLVGGWMDE